MMNVVMKSIVYASKEYEDSVDLRNEVFRKPWGLDIKNDDLSPDKNMDMYGAFLDDRLIATVFLTEDDKETARIKNVAIFKEYRGTGLGRYLMDFIENIARERGYTKAALMGRVSVEEFYKKLGYESIGEPYDYKTIPHVDMKKNL